MAPGPAPQLAEAFRLLQAGRPEEALRVAERIASDEPANGRAHLAAGIALRMLGQLELSRASLERAAAIDPKDFGAAFELGTLHEMRHDGVAALAQFERAAALRPAFTPAHFATGLQRFHAGDWSGAGNSFAKVLALEPAHAQALINLGQALAEQGRFEEALATLERALGVQPRDATARHTLGWVLHKAGRARDAIKQYEQANAIEPRIAIRHVDAARAYAGVKQWDAARDAYDRAIALEPGNAATLRAAGQLAAARGEFERAARLFEAAFALAPADVELPMFIAQARLLLGHWEPAWQRYRRREQRRWFEAQQAARGAPYRVPALGELAGREITLVAEQGLGDILFFLRFAPALAAAGARLSFAGEAKLHSLLERTGLFTALQESFEGADAVKAALLTADLPSVTGNDNPCPPSLQIAPLPQRVGRWRNALEALGPKPWIGVTWRAGTPRDILAQGLYKTIAVEDLFSTLAPLGGTVVALQRGIAVGELDVASEALGRHVHDLSGVNDDLEDALAVVSLLDRHVGVSNTNMHLAAAAGAVADVLVPFPPEWRWGIAGDSPWFPGFRVFRQDPDGGWERALEAIPRRG
jgi:tetratricopeptide (TPR) repeat protein